MGIAIGNQLGSHQITGLLGKGGMGEVWRAFDQKLGRDVAIKALPMEFAANADRMLRFEREARLLAALNHHNVAGIYGFEEHAGTRFLVLELVEGETLEDRIPIASFHMLPEMRYTRWLDPQGGVANSAHSIEVLLGFRFGGKPSPKK